ncbi:MAG: glycosyltransferase family 2 protein, partial [Gemmataceae bacterium]
MWGGVLLPSPQGERGVSVTPHPTQFNVFDLRYPIDPAAKVAILIPTKNQVDFLRGCVESLEHTVPPHLADIVVIDHESDDPVTRSYLSGLQHRVVTATGPFNFSAIMNAGVRQVRGPYTHYLFLNNDTAAPEPGWLERMLGLGCRPDVGCVGATLLYPDDTVQHAGVVVGLLEGADHAFRSWRFGKNHFEREPGDNCGLVCDRDYSAVTAACLLMRADVFDAVSGFDERLAVGFNDTDLCLRVRAAGLKVIQCAGAVLFHYESQSRGTADKHPADTALFKRRYADLLATGDPFFSPLLQPDPIMTALTP